MPANHRNAGLFAVFAILLVQWSAMWLLSRDGPLWLVLLAQIAILAALVGMSDTRARFGRPRMADVGWSLAAALAAFVLGGIIYAVQERFGLSATRAAYFDVSGWKLLSIGLYAVILVPILEEWLFRGEIQSRLRAWGPMLAILGQAVLFAAYHLAAAQFLPTLVLGALLGMLAARRGSLWGAIAAHAIYNGLGLTLFLTQMQQA